jgi:asparagine synthase (glutamine-hydrolysing)
MMNGLEARCPFQDREVVELAATLPPEVKVRGWEKKALLKQVAARWLPPEVVYRPKHGFSLPVDAWFRGEWAIAAYDVIFSESARSRGYFDYGYLEQLWSQHMSGVASHGGRFWALLWLELWHRLFVDRTMSPDDIAISDATAAVV